MPWNVAPQALVVPIGESPGYLVGSADGRESSVTRGKVVYIAGWGRSGTTLLGNILGQIDGFCDIGELNNLWRAIQIDGWLCGCGRAFSECPFWTEVLKTAFPAPNGVDAEHIAELWRRTFRTRALPGFWADATVRRRSPAPEVHARLEALYRSILQSAGASVVVDTSKHPTNAYLAAQLRALDVFVVHLVRDPRAVAYSWSRRKAAPSGSKDQTMRKYGPVKSSMWWVATNATLATVVRRSVGPGRYLRLRYEDFVQDPRGAIEQIVTMAGESPRDLPFAHSHEVDLVSTHNISGNASRFRSGAVCVAPDDEWRRAMDRRAQSLAAVISAPLMTTMGYPLRLPPADPADGSER